MRVVPAIMPEHFPPTGIVGSNDSELWLEFMGWVNSIIGAVVIARLQLLPFLKRLVYWSQASWEELAPIESFRPGGPLRAVAATPLDDRAACL